MSTSSVAHIDMSRCHYEQYDKRSVRVTGPSYIPAAELRVKLEGAGKVGERCVGIVGVRDPYTIANIDLVTAWARQQVVEGFADKATSSISPFTAATPFSATGSR